MSDATQKRRLPWFARLAIAGAVLLFAWIVVRAFVIQPFSFPSSSMRPTLEEGSTVWARKWRYGLLAPLFGDGGPRRGDVVAFRGANGFDYIKRVVAVGGDRVAMRGGQIVLNGEPVPRRGDGTAAVAGREAERWVETLPDGTSYATLDMGPSVADDRQEVAVPEGHLFVMGDNRDNSADSRFDLGFVAVENVIGEVVP